jgi:hypothetical protein
MATKQSNRTCTKCRKIKSIEEFGRDSSRKSGYGWICLICNRGKSDGYYQRNKKARQIATIERRNRNPEKFKDWALRRKFGITLEQYNQMRAEQANLCAICRQPENKVVRHRLYNLAVDHDHETGDVRGLLCADCNLALGRFSTVKRLTAAIEYLMKQR